MVIYIYHFLIINLNGNLLKLMFVRIKKDKKSGRGSVHIVESIRIGSSVKQKVIKYVGSAFTQDRLNELKNLAESLKERLKEELTPSLFNPETRINKDDDLTVSIKNLQKKEGL